MSEAVEYVPKPINLNPRPVIVTPSCECIDIKEPDYAGAVRATKRFGYVARPGKELKKIAQNPKCWLKKQVCTIPQLPEQQVGMASTIEVLGQMNNGTIRGQRNTIYNNEVKARTLAAVYSDTSFLERWVHFWSNHFTVGDSNSTRPLLGAYERDVIRQYAFQGTVSDMAVAVSQHPAMLQYLGSNENYGNNSPAAKRSKRLGLNENFGREILELYCVGVDSGSDLSQPYTEIDVVEASRILTGWRMVTDIDPKTGFHFDVNAHEPGMKKVLGKYYNAGYEEGVRFVKDICSNKYAARFIATKLARHFVGDNPPKSAVDKLEIIFNRTGGNMKSLALTLIEMPEAWDKRNLKHTNSNDFIINTMRVLSSEYDFSQVTHHELNLYYNTLNQPVWGSPFPEGWCDKAACWISGRALTDRINTSLRMVQISNPFRSPQKIYADVLGSHISDQQYTAIERSNPKTCKSLTNTQQMNGCTIRAVVAAQNTLEAYTLLFNSPDMQQR